MAQAIQDGVRDRGRDTVTHMSEDQLTEAFVEFADTLVDDFDVIDFLHRLSSRCVQLLDVDAVGLMLSDPYGQLRVMAASSEQARLMELFQLQTDQGPCVSCYHRGEPVSQEDLSIVDEQWPQLSQLASELGFRSVFALPMRLRAQIVGVINLFRTTSGPMTERDLRVGQALADVATIGLLQERAARRQQVLAEQLQTALNTRVVIEQAKGVLAERLKVDMDTAFRTLRQYARAHSAQLRDVAHDVTTGAVDMAVIAGAVPQLGDRRNPA